MLSKNAVGIALLLVSLFGLDISESQVVDFVSAAGQVISFALLVWNQIDRKDVSWFFWKK